MNQWRRRLWYCCLFAVATWAIARFFWPSPAQPNILLITLDTTRADRIGCYGYEPAETTRLDALARRGVLFERAYAAAPMTSPSHTSLFTGLWPPEHGVFTNGQISLDSGIPTLATLLQQRGFDTAAFVAALVLEAKFGLNQGFQAYDDDLSTADAKSEDVLHRYRDGRFVIDSVVKWLTRHRQQTSRKPFFCWVHLYDPHEPYLAHPQEFGDKFDDRLYDGELAYTDRQIGRLLDALDQLGASDDTVIIVVGDHGESLGEHGEQEHGFMLHESTLRVPLIIVDPRRQASGHRVSTPISLVDLFPTVLEIGGAQPPVNCASRSLSPALAGKPLRSRICYSQTEEPYLQAFWSPLQGLTTDRWRYVRTTKPELYDLSADPHELANLADQLPDQVSDLDGELSAFEGKFMRRTGARVALSAQEQRALESLGYAGGSSAGPERAGGGPALPDVKDMIGYINQLRQADELIDRQDFEAAAAILEPLAENVPNFYRARLNLGQCRLHQQNFEEAVRWLKAALEIDPNSDRALEMLGFAYLKLRQLDLAAETFRELLERRPESENGNLFLGEVYQRQENYPAAMRYYQKVLQINPRNTAATRTLQTLRDAGYRP